MKTRIKNLWTKALRSGKYKQGKGRLRTLKNEFCCLGVLCDLYVKVKKHKTQWERPLGADRYIINGDGGLLSNDVIKWAGISNATLVEINGYKKLLFQHNDSGIKFKQIAKAIEEQL